MHCKQKISTIISKCLHNVEMLKVSECELTTNGIKCIAVAIEQRIKPVLTILSRKSSDKVKQKMLKY